jgi:Na+/melibiose symporter-like transporter
VLGLMAAALAAGAGFFVAEHRSDDPLLSLELFGDRVFALTNAVGLLTSMAFIGVVTFLPLYLQLGVGMAPTASGVALIPLILGLILSAAATGLLATKTGRYKGLLVAGAGLMTLGALGLSRISPQSQPWDIAWRVGLLGVGLGPMQSLLSLAVQNVVPADKIGIATSVSQFFREAGSTLGVAVLGTVLNTALAAALPGGRAATLSDLQTVAVAAQGGSRGPGLDMVARLAITHAIQNVMIAAMAICVLGLIAAAFVPSRKLKAGARPA